MKQEQAAPIPAANVAAVAQTVAAVGPAPPPAQRATPAPIVPEHTFDARLAADNDNIWVGI